jgi:hypothetical protein
MLSCKFIVGYKDFLMQPFASATERIDPLNTLNDAKIED